MFGIDEGSVRPQLPCDFLARQQLAGPLQKQAEQLKGLRVQLDAGSRLRNSPVAASASNTPKR